MPKSTYSKERKVLSQLLVEARESAGLTQNQVATTGILSQTELSKIENGQRKVEFLILVKLASVYKKDLKFFIPNSKK
jgi:transcriptional regulator with XRE-family HTH domain